MSANLAGQFVSLILSDAPNAAYLDLARRAMAGGVSETEVEQCFADAAYSAFPEPRIAERLCQLLAATL